MLHHAGDWRFPSRARPQRPGGHLSRRQAIPETPPSTCDTVIIPPAAPSGGPGPRHSSGAVRRTTMASRPRNARRPLLWVRGALLARWLWGSLLTVVPAALFALLADAVISERALHVDRVVFDGIARADNPMLPGLAALAPVLGYIVPPFALGFATWRLIRRDRAAVVGLLGVMGVLGLVLFAHIARPHGGLIRTAQSATALDRLFPDMHTLVAVVACGASVSLYGRAASRLRLLIAVAVALAVIGVIALGSLVTNIAYVSDVVGALLLGGSWCGLSMLAAAHPVFQIVQPLEAARALEEGEGRTDNDRTA
jgi:membrane-associated phospholipid phosphatase